MLSVVASDLPDDDAWDLETFGEWTNLSDRVRTDGTVTWGGGRQNERSDFDPRQAIVTLDNSDQMLSIDNPDSLVYTEGRPGCPVRIAAVWGGHGYVLFAGYLGPECWPATSSAYGPESTVDLIAFDRMGLPLAIPSDSWGAFIQSIDPNWWLRMDTANPVLSTGSPVPDRAGTGGNATATVPSGIMRPTAEGTIGGTQPAMVFAPTNYLTSAAADVMPNGDENNVTVALFWRADTALSTGEQAVVAQLSESGTGDLRWQIIVDEDGEAQVTSYEADGVTVYDSGTVVRSIVPRWDDGNAHMVIVRCDSGAMDVWFGGDQLTLTCEATVYESDLIVGPADVDTAFDEVTLWRSALTDPVIDGLILATGGLYGPWHGDTWLERIGHWFDCIGLPDSDFVNSFDTLFFPDDDADGFWGLGKISSNPGTWPEAMRRVAESGGGHAYALRNGNLQARSLAALTDSDAGMVAAFQTQILHLTDEPSPAGSPTPVRRTQVQLSGLLAQRVIDRVEATFYTPSATGQPQQFTYSPGAVQSDNTAQLTTEWTGWLAVTSIADGIVARYTEPPQEVGPVVVNLNTLDDDAMLAMLQDVELERAVKVTYTPFGADPISLDQNIQREQWTISGYRWDVELVVAKS